MKRMILIRAVAAIAAAMMAIPVAAQAKDVRQSKDVVYICTGSDTGNYYKVGEKLKGQLRQLGLEAAVVATQGSVQNLNLLTSDRSEDKHWCDVGIAQNDAVRNFIASNSKVANQIERIEPLYYEKVHFLINRDVAKKMGIDRVPNIRDKKGLIVNVGTAGSGNIETWNSLKAADPSYDKVATANLTNTKALAAISAGDKVHAMIYTAGFKTPFMIDAAKDYGKTVMIIGFDDGDLDNAKDEKGRPIYSLTAIPGGDPYRNLQEKSVWCAGACQTKTAKVAAMLMAVSDFEERFGEKGYKNLLRAVNNIKGSVAAEFDPE